MGLWVLGTRERRNKLLNNRRTKVRKRRVIERRIRTKGRKIASKKEALFPHTLPLSLTGYRLQMLKGEAPGRVL